jgi:anti-anti-sigma factor
MVANPEPVRRAPDVVAANIRVVRATDTTTALAVEGECDLTTAPGLSDIAQRVIAEGRNLIIDLSDVSFLDASTVRALLDADVAAQQRGCELVVQLGRATFVERVLSITGADRKLVTAATRGAAMALVATAA